MRRRLRGPRTLRRGAAVALSGVDDNDKAGAPDSTTATASALAASATAGAAAFARGARLRGTFGSADAAEVASIGLSSFGLGGFIIGFFIVLDRQGVGHRVWDLRIVRNCDLPR